jgi:hypothetical protein
MTTDRTVDADVAEKGPEFERKVGEIVGRRRAPAPVVVDEDTHVVREDLGEGAVTFVAAGDAIPVELAGLPRRPARPASRKK